MIGVLTYHAIDRSHSPISVTPEQFRAHVQSLRAGGVSVVPLAELRQHGERAVSIVFDDGFRSVLEHAKPALDAIGATATVFVVSERVGLDNRWNGQGDEGIPVAPLMTWSDLQALIDAGWDVGAHTRTHPRLSTLDRVAVVDEVVESANTIQRRLGVHPTAFAYPYGDTGLDAPNVVREHFAMGFTTELRAMGRVGEDQACLPRLDAYYFRRRSLADFGSWPFRTLLRTRQLGRELRAKLA